jgi:hypothetical protein
VHFSIIEQSRMSLFLLSRNMQIVNLRRSTEIKQGFIPFQNVARHDGECNFMYARNKVTKSSAPISTKRTVIK